MSTSRPIWCEAWPRHHRAAARLRHVADEKSRPAVDVAASFASFSMKSTRTGRPHCRFRDSRIACQFGPVGRKLHGAGHAAAAVEADRLGRQRRRQRLGAEKLLRRLLGDGGGAAARSSARIERAAEA